jgi:AraC family transcriptional regulator of adaptative response / DNA-3-methyladenine glycosylase II
VESLATRLGVTSRHLRRLFTRHLGASPLAVAHTQRLQFAKQLIDQTTLPMQDIAVAAGYGSVRRFNDSFVKTYGRSPRELRRVGDNSRASGSESALTVELACSMPFDWQNLLAFFAVRAIPGVESVDGGRYLRAMMIDGQPGTSAGCREHIAHNARYQHAEHLPRRAALSRDVRPRCADAGDRECPVQGEYPAPGAASN